MSILKPAIFERFQFPTTREGVETDRNEISPAWWLFFPVTFFVVRYAVSIFTNRTTGLESWFRDELGIVENLTVLFLLAAMVYTLYLLKRFGGLLHVIPKIFLYIYCIGCVYFAGEEASWGQHWFGWETGEYFLAINDQQETNFHNTSVLLDRTPKALISFLIFFGGIVIPVILSCKSLKIDFNKSMWWIFPTWICLPTAFFASFATWPSKVEHHTDWHFYFDQAQEMKEFYIAYFMLLYILSLGRRIHRLQASGKAFSPL